MGPGPIFGAFRHGPGDGASRPERDSGAWTSRPSYPAERGFWGPPRLLTPCHTRRVRGSHIAPSGPGKGPVGVEPQDLSDAWLQPSTANRWLRTAVRARGVPRPTISAPTLLALWTLVTWPVGWVVHLWLYLGEWRVRVVESQAGWYTAGQARHDRLPSRGERRRQVPL
jgi:hypothetical protein